MLFWEWVDNTFIKCIIEYRSLLPHSNKLSIFSIWSWTHEPPEGGSSISQPWRDVGGTGCSDDPTAVKDLWSPTPPEAWCFWSSPVPNGWERNECSLHGSLHSGCHHGHGAALGWFRISKVHVYFQIHCSKFIPFKTYVVDSTWRRCQSDVRGAKIILLLQGDWELTWPCIVSHKCSLNHTKF